MLSERLHQAIQAYPGRQWELAHKAAIHPTTLAKLKTGHERPRAGDERVIRLGAVLGLPPEDCFAVDQAAVA